jgi:hypothetical protein
MRAVVVYESMFGCTHQVASAIAEALAGTGQVEVLPVAEAHPAVLEGVDLLVVGGPTHIHGMSSSRSRHMAAEMAAKPDSELELDADAEGQALRDWFHDLPKLEGVTAAAFDTRISSVSPLMSGRASTGVARRLRHLGADLVGPPESFLVDENNQLVHGEQQGSCLGEDSAGGLSQRLPETEPAEMPTE